MKNNRMHFRAFMAYICLFVLSGCGYWGALPNAPSQEAQPSWSPDSTQLVYVCYLDGPVEGKNNLNVLFDQSMNSPKEPWAQYTEEARDICLINYDGTNFRHLVSQEGSDSTPSWSPDGVRIAYLRSNGICIIGVKGENNRCFINQQVNYYESLAWSSDGEKLLFSATLDNSDYDVYWLDIITGEVSNVTSHLRTNDISARWMLDDTEIFFQAAGTYTYNGEVSSTTHLIDVCQIIPMKVIDIDGSNEKILFDSARYSTFNTTNSGKIFFISNLRTQSCRDDTPNSRRESSLYRISVTNNELTPMLSETKQISWPIRSRSISPNNQYIITTGSNDTHKVFNTDLQVEYDLLKTMNLYTASYIDDFSWSSNGKYVAFTNILEFPDGGELGHYEGHVYIFNLEKQSLYRLVQP